MLLLPEEKKMRIIPTQLDAKDGGDQLKNRLPNTFERGKRSCILISIYSPLWSF